MKKPPNANRAARSTAGPALLSLPRPFILTLVTLILPLLIIGCSFDYRDSRLSESLEEEVANNVLKKYVHTSVKNGVPAFEVRAESSRIYFKSKRAELSEVSFTEFDTEGEALAEGRAGGATVFTGSDNVELEGNVVFRHLSEDFRIEAPYLYWNNGARSFEGKETDTVRIERENGSRLSGTGFRSSGIYRKIDFEGPVEGIYIDEREDAEGERFSFSGNSTSIIMREGKRRTLLTGNAEIQTGSISISADSIELYGEEFRFARCRGNVETEDKEKGLHLSSQKLFFDREKDILRIEGYNEMIDYRNELVAKSSYLEHRGETEETLFQIGVRILKATDESKLVCRGEFARYDREREELILSGMPSVSRDEDTYQASRIIINLDSDEIRLEGDVEGTVSTSKKDTGEQQNE